LNTPAKSTEPSVARSLETCQLVGRILAPAIFALMLVTDQWQDVMNPQAWRLARAALH
jgi:hypothetical protein